MRDLLIFLGVIAVCVGIPLAIAVFPRRKPNDPNDWSG